MSNLINQIYVIETKDGRFYEKEVEMYADDEVINTVLKVVAKLSEAKRFSDYKEANEIALAYGFNVLALNTYLEEV
ncbi:MULTISPECIES: hypothetical protein [Staphylococcus]|uniref:Uncharacterized protein n=1 Tax=Staphylococcus virus IME1354_01 TaxID=3070820 RepID=A0A1W6JQ62_9CAUD|nr:hypothetical protein [Staphylococcus ureilyticus]YP_010648361.1 hypothetical protein PP279_gp37 [Staphylococcus virus IME1354_01]ARM68369.1 hypothetical protein [Staphylococcus virus IME1354_01]OJT35333.1 hypothetical protein BSF33_04575 [Staphylococcus ureilyticus]